MNESGAVSLFLFSDTSESFSSEDCLPSVVYISFMNESGAMSFTSEHFSSLPSINPFSVSISFSSSSEFIDSFMLPFSEEFEDSDWLSLELSDTSLSFPSSFSSISFGSSLISVNSATGTLSCLSSLLSDILLLCSLSFEGVTVESCLSVSGMSFSVNFSSCRILSFDISTFSLLSSISFSLHSFTSISYLSWISSGR